MRPDLAEAIVADFEQGKLSRRQLAARLMGLGAALASTTGQAGADDQPPATFQATGLDHIALNVTDVARSRDFYIKHLGLKVIRDGGNDVCFLGAGKTFFLTLFRADTPSMDHYSYAVPSFSPDQAEAKLKAAGLETHRESDRIYFQDPDGLMVQISGA